MEWISTKEKDKLPGMFGSYFITVAKPGEEPYVDTACRCEFSKGEYGWMNWHSDYSEDEVSHWMPYPEPAKIIKK